MDFVPSQFTSLLFFSFGVEERKLIALDKSYGIILSRVGGHGLVLNPGSKANSEYSTHLL